MDLSEKVAYLKGLQEGLHLNASAPETKLFAQISDILGDMADTLETLSQDHQELSDRVDEIDMDLGDLETLVLTGDTEPEDDSATYEVECPKCGEKITFDEPMLDKGGIQCPNCGTELEFDLDGASEEASA